MNIGIKNNTNIKVEKRVSIIDKTLRRLQENWRSIVIIIPFVWLLMFFLFPFFIVAKISLAEMKIASPPFTSMVEWADGGIVTIRIVFDNFLYIINDSLYIDTYLNSVKIASTATVISLLLGYPIAYGIVRSGPVAKPILLFMVILPFWTSFLLRVYAWMGLLADQGTINSLLISLGVINEPIQMLYSEFAVYVGIVYTYLPFMILPLYANMEKLDGSLNKLLLILAQNQQILFSK